MNAVIHYGAPTKAGQVVSAEVQTKGLNLVRTTPTLAFPEVDRKYTTPQYLNYQNNLAAAVEAAIENKYVYFKSSQHFYQPSTLFQSPYMRIPVVVWSYGREISGDSISQIRERYSGAETMSQGRPALLAALSPTQVKSLVQDTSPVQTTPSSSTNMNINSYRVYVRLHKLADLFFRIHQYPLIAKEDEGQTQFFRDAFLINVKDVEKSLVTFNAGDATKEYKAYNFRNFDRMKMNMNLIERDLSKVKYTISEASEHTGESSLLFPFVQALCREDDSMVLYTIERFLFNLLGSSAADARRVFTEIKESWGNLKITLWGDELSHIFSAIRLALETGGHIKIVVTPNSIYQGFVLVGAGYTLTQYGNIYSPVGQSVFSEVFSRASPHLQAFTTLLGMIQFPSDMDRQGAKTSLNTVQKISHALRTHGFDGSKIERILDLAKLLTFPSDNYLAVTAHNVTRILTAMTGSESEENFPLHPVAVLERDRNKRLLSAFGATAPSFIIPGGRVVGLEGSFTYNMAVGGKKETKTTTRMFALVVPWAKACSDLDRVRVEKQVYTPIGTALAGRASTFSITKEFTGAGGASVLGALRVMAGVALGGGADSSKGKRKAEDDSNEAPPAKKVNYDEF